MLSPYQGGTKGDMNMRLPEDVAQLVAEELKGVAHPERIIDTMVSFVRFQLMRETTEVWDIVTGVRHG